MRHILITSFALITLSGLALSGCTSVAVPPTLTPQPSSPPMPNPAPLVGGFNTVSVTDQGVIAAADAAITAEQQALTKAEDRPISIELVSIDQARAQVVAGMNYQLSLTVIIDGTTKKAYATIYRNLAQPPVYALNEWIWPPK